MLARAESDTAIDHRRRVHQVDRASDRARWLSRGRRLVAVTLAYNTVEAVVALWAGARAGSIALVGFGIDSVIELAAGAVVYWRLGIERGGASAARVETAEEGVRRFVGATLLLLAVYVSVESVSRLLRSEPAAESAIGLVLAAASLILMPVIAMLKFRAARHVDSKALRAEAIETLACAYLSLALFAGLAGNAWLGWWWADAAGGLLMVPFLAREGLESIRAEDDGGEG